MALSHCLTTSYKQIIFSVEYRGLPPITVVLTAYWLRSDCTKNGYFTQWPFDWDSKGLISPYEKWTFVTKQPYCSQLLKPRDIGLVCAMNPWGCATLYILALSILYVQHVLLLIQMVILSTLRQLVSISAKKGWIVGSCSLKLLT